MKSNHVAFAIIISLGTVALIVFDDILRNVLRKAKDEMRTIPMEFSFDDLPLKCKYLFRNNDLEIERARVRMLKDVRVGPSIDHGAYSVMTQNCTEFKRHRNYILNVTREEEEFPIAFSVLMYRNVEQFERLLRAVYRPHNYYCVHVDSKTSGVIRDAVSNIVNCFPNIFLSSSSVDVRWGEFSVLEPELVCIRDLLKHNRKWKYFINLTGQEFPLKTNYQLVKILRAYSGANDVSATVSRIFENAYRWWLAGPPPADIRPVKGAVHIIANRHFVDYAVHHPVAHDLLQWVKKTKVPDETFFATLNHNPQLRIPGSYQGEPETDPITKPFLARYKVWDKGLFFFLDDCQGKYVRHICIFGVGDLHRLVQRKHLFANKFQLDFEPLVLDCMEEWYFNMTHDEHLGKLDFDDRYYRNLGFVKNQVPLSPTSYRALL
ncbi:beta-1,3-galactosyl-O-glycosyl-glycoprotein beta-1,6-N-acetylglucosaminyltransferase 3-like [Haliotis rubra]|uniref:beta-1,3-galactosyl-O-glycosyl-glycoprotein beta-1,6-N-acetylglucosaminyltransferase 3-like n=1 Tax=Haliotis rubra TaxID=36100 RepID=UPI001EE631C4|nr:beta-1,3-galactosyl-O-glycosyl-glycoprotein beta-1,6-N-acetylglucosaminyltransferase 3-like [Haliotis rubra]